MEYSSTTSSGRVVPGVESLVVRVCKDNEGKKLDWGSLNALIHINNAKSIAIEGGEANLKMLDFLFEKMHSEGLTTCWISDLESLPKDLALENIDYVHVQWKVTRRGPKEEHVFRVRHKADHDEIEDITFTFNPWTQKTKQ